jgi:hypothetical protein
LVSDPTTRTDENRPVRIAHSVLRQDATGPIVSASDVKDWLAKHGFAAVDWGGGRVWERGQVSSLFGSEKEIVVHVNEQAGEVTDLYCRFTLPRPTAPPVSEWAALMATFCARFNFRLGESSSATCAESEFVAAVTSRRNYRMFARSFGWEQTDSEQPTATDVGGQQDTPGQRLPRLPTQQSSIVW